MNQFSPPSLSFTDELLPIIGEYGDHTNHMISPQERSGLLMILSAVMTSAQLTIGKSLDEEIQSLSSKKWTTSTADLMKNVVSTLSLPVVCESDAIEVQSQLVEVMLDVISVGCADVNAKNTRTTSFALLDSTSVTNLQFVRILVQLQSTPGEEPAPVKVRNGATSTMVALAEASGSGGTSDIFAAHFERLLRIILAGRSNNDNEAKDSSKEDSVAQVQVIEGEQKRISIPTLIEPNTKEKISTMARRAGKWEKDTPQRRLFDTLIRQSMASTTSTTTSSTTTSSSSSPTTTPSTNPVGDNLHLILPILETTLQVSCDPDLRMGMLALIATMLENPYVATVCRQREAYGGTMLQRLFLPNAVWRVGRVASSVRKIVTRCISTLLRHRLVTPDALQVLWQEPNNLLHVMKSCLDDDEPLTRQYTALALMNIFQVMEGRLEMETCMVSVCVCLFLWWLFFLCFLFCFVGNDDQRRRRHSILSEKHRELKNVFSK